MKNEENKLDDLYRNKLEHFELAASDKLLKNIKGVIANEASGKNKKKFGWLWLNMVIAVVATAAFFIYQNKMSKKQTGEDITIATNKNNDEQAATKATAKQLIPSENNANTEKAVSNQLAAEANAIKQNSTTALTSTKTENSLNTSVAANKGEAKKEEREKDVLTDNKQGSLNKEKTNTTNANKNSASNETTMPINKAQKAIVDDIETNATINNSAGNSFAATKQSEQNATNDIQKNKEQVANTTKANTVDSIQSFSNKNETLTKSDSVKKNTIASDSIKATTANTAKPSEPSKASDSKKKTPFYIEGFGGPSFYKRSLSSADADLLANKNSNEKTKLGYAAGLNFGAIIKNNWNISIGIAYDKKIENYSYKGKTTNARTDTIVVIDSIFQGIIYSHIEYITTPGNSIPDTKATNTYSYLAIPFSVSYNFNFANKWLVAPEIAVLANILLSASSTWYDEKQNKTVTYTKSESVYAPLVLSGKAALNLGYNINEHWSIRLKPAYHYFFQSIYKSDFIIRQKPYSVDVNVGLRYSF